MSAAPSPRRSARARPRPSITRIEGEMTASRAALLQGELVEAVAQQAPVRLDLSAVTAMDTTGVQLLLQLERAARARGTQLYLEHPSDAVHGVLRLLWLEDHFAAALQAPAPATEAPLEP